MRLWVLILLALSSAVAAIEAPSAAHVRVIGSAKQQVEPDMANLTLMVTALDPKGTEAKQAVDRKIAALFGKLTNLGIDAKSINAGNLVVQPEYHYQSDAPPKLLGYRAQRQLTFALYKLDKLSETLDSALAVGVDNIAQIEYGLKNVETVQKEVRLAAINSAKAEALALAQGFDANLGKVYAINEQDQEFALPYRTMKAGAPMAEAGGSYQQPTITLTDSVEVIFLLE